MNKNVNTCRTIDSEGVVENDKEMSFKAVKLPDDFPEGRTTPLNGSHSIFNHVSTNIKSHMNEV